MSDKPRLPTVAEQASVSMEYAIALEADPIDLGDIRRIFGGDGTIRVREIEVPQARRVAALMTDDFDGLVSDTQVLEIGRRFVAQINGVLFAGDPDRAIVRMGALYTRHNRSVWGSGVVHVSANVKLGRLRARGHLVHIGPDGSPVSAVAEPPRQAAWLALAAADNDGADRVADVLHAFSGEPDWFDLWKAEEVIHGDQHSISDWPKDEVEWFRQTATRYRHSPSTRHGRKAQEWLGANQRSEMNLE